MLPVHIESLPVELLYEVQLFALSPVFPYSSKHIYQVFKTAPSSYVAQYIMRASSQKGANKSDILTKALRYSSCGVEVVGTLFQFLSAENTAQLIYCQLPRRLFRNLNPRPGIETWNDDDDPLPFLQYLYTIQGLRPDANSHEGYALTKAVQARHEPLIRFLLAHDASPRFKEGLCVMVAIRQKDLCLVRMLIERRDNNPTSKARKHKKRKLEDRVAVTRDMLRLAIKHSAHDIAEYLVQEKGVVPDMQTLRRI